MLTKRGFTMIELLIALVLMGIVSTAIYTLLVNNQRLYRQQTLRIELNDNLRSATAILPADLRELNSGDPLGSDIQEMTASSITYKAMRNLYVLCMDANAGNLYLDATLTGLRGLEPDHDSLLVFADNDPNIMTDDRWLHVDVTQVQPGNVCNGQPGINVSVSPAIPAAANVVAGSPVRGFEMVQAASYADAAGVEWLGARRYSKASLWTDMQPVVGPLQTGGFRLSYFDASGIATANPSLVARIDMTVIGKTSQPVRLDGGVVGYLVDTLTTQVALRNR